MENEVYAKFVCHNLMVLIAEMYALGIDAIFPAGDREPVGADEPAILRFPTRL